MALQVVWVHLLVMSREVVLGEIANQVLKPRSPDYLKVAQCDLIHNPKTTHVH